MDKKRLSRLFFLIVTVVLFSGAVDSTVYAAVPTATFSASATSVNIGGSSTLTWITTGATSVTINQGIGTVATSGSTTVSSITTTKTYTLTATGAGGTTTRTVTVSIYAPTATLSASPTSIAAGSPSTLTWTATNVTSVSIDQGIGTVYSNTPGAASRNGTRSVSPSSTKVYTLTATGPGGQVAATATVTVTPPPTVNYFNANPTNIVLGDSCTLSWSTTGATSVSIDQGIGSVVINGTKWLPQINATTTYTLTATGAGGTTTAAVTVSVRPPTASLSASPTTILSGGSSTLSWSAANVTSVTINQGVGTVYSSSTGISSISGVRSVSPTITKTYTVTATGPSGEVTQTATVTVTPLPTVTFNASPASIMLGETSTLTWSTTNATSVIIDQGVGSVSTSGTQAVAPTTTRTYAISVTGPGGSASASVSVVVYQPPTAELAASPANIFPTGTSTLTWSTTNAQTITITPGIGAVASSGSVTVSPATTTVYTITATGPGGTLSRQATVSVYPAPTISISADPIKIQAGESSTLQWQAANADSVVIGPGIGSVGLSGSQSVSPIQTTVYTISATNPAGTTTARVTVYIPHIIRVPADYTTIQAGINAAVDGDTVLVADGTYTGSGNRELDLNRKFIILQSENGPANCVIDGQNSHRAFSLIGGLGTGKDTVISGFTILNGNAASGDGGGIYVDGSSPTIENCILSNCTVGNAGSAIYFADGSPTIENCLISGCSGGYGSIYCLNSSSGVIRDCRIINNTGTGIECNNSSVEILNCEVKNNIQSNWRAGGIYFSNSTGTVKDSIISNNTSGRYGGGISLGEASDVAVENCIISYNLAQASELSAQGGGICSQSSSISLTGCVIRNNSVVNSDGSYTWGGGLLLSGHFEIVNCFIVENSADLGAGIRMHFVDSTSKIINTTISGNLGIASYASGNALHCQQAAPTVMNSILDGPVYSYDSIYPIVTHSLCHSNLLGEGNFYADPLFVGNGDYHIRENSPCKDTGTLVDVPDTDIDGETRPYQGGVDIGADEYHESPPTIAVTATPSYILPGESSVLAWKTVMANAVVADSGIGTITANGSLRVSPTETTTYTFTATGIGGEITQSVTVKVVSGLSVNPDGTGDFTTIQGAINAAVENDIITVADGTYPGGIDFNGKNITLKSENGAAHCIIDCNGSGRGFTFDNGETLDAVVSGFTIRNGNVGNDKGGGIYIYGASPTISSCIIENNQSLSSGGGIHCLDSSARILSCVIKENNASINGGGICLKTANAEVINCTILDNTAATGGGLYCTDNSTPTVTNCILLGNSPNQTMAALNSTPAVSYSHIEGGYPGGIGMILCGVSFDESGYHLIPGSWAVDTGVAVPYVTTDIDGQFRVYGAGVDIGADEFKRIQVTDSDNDGLDDNWEMAHFGSLDKLAVEDPDGDGMDNLWEFQKGTDPNASDPPADTDKDMLPDALEMDWFDSIDCSVCGRDNDADYAGADGLTNLQEYQLGTWPQTNTSYSCEAVDDGLNDLWEFSNFNNYTQGPNDDPDGDGYTNFEEYVSGTNPNVGAPIYITVHIEISGDGKVVLEDGTEIEANSDITLTADFNDLYTLTFVPGDHRVVHDVTVDYYSQEAKSSVKILKDKNYAVHVDFYESPHHFITPTAGIHGSISPNSVTKIYEGESLTFTFTPDDGYAVSDVLVNGVSVGEPLNRPLNNQYTFSNVTADQTIEVKFAQAFIIAASSTPAGAGTISPSGSVATVITGEQTFTFTPNPHYHISDVVVDGVSKGALSNYPFTDVTSAHTIQVVFAEDTFYWITTVVDGSGSITPGGPVKVYQDGSQTFTFLPNSGNIIQAVWIDDVLLPGQPASYASSGVNANHTLKVKFVTTALSDLDGINGDGLPDQWQSLNMPLYSSGTCNKCAAGNDYDGDGISNYSEYVLGSNPDGEPTGDGSSPGIDYEYDELGRVKRITRIPKAGN